MKTIKTLFILSVSLVVLFAGTSAAREEKGTNQVSTISFLHRLEKKSSDIKSLQTDFVQEKKLAAFKNKIVIRGRLYLQKPDKLAWHVDDPIKYSVLITDEFMRQWDEETDQVQEITFSQNPMFKVIFSQLRGWFNGSYTSFLKDYNVRLLQPAAPFVLEFTPKAKSAVKKIIKYVKICVQKDERYLKWIEIKDISDDTTTINFINTILNIPLDPAFFEVKRVD